MTKVAASMVQDHRELHRNGNEMAWWANVQVAPIEAAKDFWDATLSEQSNVQPK